MNKAREHASDSSYPASPELFGQGGDALDWLLHELRQPLNLTRLVVQELQADLRDGSLDPEALSENLEELKDGIDQLATRLGHTRSFVQRHVYDKATHHPLAEILMQTCERFRTHFPASKLELATSDCPAISAEPCVGFALWEVIVNAERATRENPNPRVSVVCHERAGQAVIEVRDNGVGIPDEHVERVFEPFFSTLGAPGIGLPLAKWMLRTIRGELSLESTSPSGTVFVLSLPTSSEASDG